MISERRLFVKPPQLTQEVLKQLNGMVIARHLVLEITTAGHTTTFRRLEREGDVSCDTVAEPQNREGHRIQMILDQASIDIPKD